MSEACSQRMRPLEPHSRAQGERVPLVLAARLPGTSYVRICSSCTDFVSRIEAISERHRGALGETRAGARTKELDALATQSCVGVRIPAELAAYASATARLSECVSPRREVAIGRRRIVSELASADSETPIPAAGPPQR